LKTSVRCDIITKEVIGVFYGATILIVLINLFSYFSFRSGIREFLRLKKMSKTNIRKNKKGFKNYWFYQEINKIKPLGWMYYANIIYFFLTLFYTVFALSLGYIKSLQPVFFAISILLCIVQIPTTAASEYYSNLYTFGTPVVLCRRYPDTRRYLSTPLDYVIPWVITGLLIFLSFEEMCF